MEEKENGGGEKAKKTKGLANRTHRNGHVDGVSGSACVYRKQGPRDVSGMDIHVGLPGRNRVDNCKRGQAA